MYENISQKRQRPQITENYQWFSISFAKKTSGKHSDRNNNLVCGKLESVVTFLQKVRSGTKKMLHRSQVLRSPKNTKFCRTLPCKKGFTLVLHLSTSVWHLLNRKTKGLEELSIFNRWLSNVSEYTDYYFPHLFRIILALIQLRLHWHSNHNQNFDSDKSWILVLSIEYY